MNTTEQFDLGQFQPVTLAELQGLSDTTAQDTLADALGIPEVSVQEPKDLGLMLMATTASCADIDGDQ